MTTVVAKEVAIMVCSVIVLQCSFAHLCHSYILSWNKLLSLIPADVIYSMCIEHIPQTCPLYFIKPAISSTKKIIFE